MSSVHIALFGHGVVGGGVSRILTRDKISLSQKAGVPIELSAICTKNPQDDAEFFAHHHDLFRSAEEIFADPQISIVCECIGGDTIAYDFVKTALKSGKHVVTANKKMIAKHFLELSELSQKHGTSLLFEAAVGGGIPCLTALRNGISGDRITELQGILNGTTNFILTEMEEQGVEFADVLSEAQNKGYAEADPTDDVDGFDAAYKLSILIALAFGVYFPPEKIDTTGISSLTSADFLYARTLGKKIKLIAHAKKTKDGVLASVSPTLLPLSSRLAKTDGVLNAINIIGTYNTQGNFLSGEGAGRFPTAAAIVSDIISIARGEEATLFSRPLAKHAAPKKQAYYLRFLVHDTPGIVGTIGTIFGEHEISIDAVHQIDHQKNPAHFMLTTMPVEHDVFENALDRVRSCAFNVAPPLVLPIQEEE